MENLLWIVPVVLVAVLWEPVRRWRKKQKGASVEPAKATGAPFPCVIEGSVDGSPMADRVKALAIEAASKGITITGNYADDVAKQGGEMHLIGTGFKFTIDATGQIVNSASWCNLFLKNWPCEGGMNPDGTLGVDVVVDTARVQVQGKVVNGQFVNGKVVKTWLFVEGQPPHIYGVLNGTYRKVSP